MNKQKSKKVLVLAGGLGTRLRPLTFVVPKPLISVRGRPIIDYLIARLLYFGFEDIHVSLNYRADLIKLYLTDKIKKGISINFLDETVPLGTAGPLALFKEVGVKIGKNESVLVINGDILTDLDFGKFLSKHNASGADLTVALSTYSQALPYGVIETDSKENIVNVSEKPTFRYKICAGIYLLKQSCINLVPKQYFIMPDLIQISKASDLLVKGYQIKEHWISIEQIKNIEEVHKVKKNDWIFKISPLP